MSSTPPRFSFQRAYVASRRALKYARAIPLQFEQRNNPKWSRPYRVVFDETAQFVEVARKAFRPVSEYLKAVGCRPPVRFAGRNFASSHEAAIEAANEILSYFDPACGGPYRLPHPAEVYLQLESLLEQERSSAIARFAVLPVGGQHSGDGGKTPTLEGRKLATKGKNINALMLALLTDSSECIQWSAQQFADHLGCSKSTVIGTTAWKELRKTQVGEKAKRINQRERTTNDREN